MDQMRFYHQQRKVVHVPTNLDLTLNFAVVQTVALSEKVIINTIEAMEKRVKILCKEIEVAEIEWDTRSSGNEKNITIKHCDVLKKRCFNFFLYLYPEYFSFNI